MRSQTCCNRYPFEIRRTVCSFYQTTKNFFVHLLVPDVLYRDWENPERLLTHVKHLTALYLFEESDLSLSHLNKALMIHVKDALVFKHPIDIHMEVLSKTLFSLAGPALHLFFVFFSWGV